MRRRPMILPVIMLMLFGVALSFPLQVMWLYDHGLGELPQVLNKLTWLNWLVMAGAVLTGVFVFGASPFTRFALPALTFIVAVNNFFVGYFATDYSFMATTMGTFAFGAMLLPLYQPKVRELLLYPDRRWWRAKTRRRMAVPIFVGGSRQVKLRSETFDISESGAFLPIEAAGLYVEERVSICLTLGTLQQIRCDARVVRRAEAKGTYPGGVGITFTNMDWWQRRELKRYLARQL